MNHDEKLNTGGGGSSADALPDYYLGFLIFHDELGDDNCRWVVYDGLTRVRCPTRRSAIDYIVERRQTATPDITSRLLDARISLNRAIEQLDRAADTLTGLTRLQLQRLAVRLKPVLVEIDNIVLD